MKKEMNNGITLVALVITIVILLILAGISINIVLGDNGVVTKAQQAKISTNLGSYYEQLNMFITDKKMENNDFYEGSLTAGKSTLSYNTKNYDGGTIKDIIPNISDEYLDKLEIIKGKLVVNTQDKRLIKIVQDMGLEANPYNIVDGVLTSSNNNLLLVDDQGTLTLPDSVNAIGEGAFSNVEGLKTIIIPGTVKTIGKNAFRANSTLEKVIVMDGVETIEASAFEGCGNLKEIIMPDSIDSIEEYVFYNCRNLKYIEIPANIENINQMTFSYTGVSDVIIRGKKIKRIENEAFCNCKIKKIEITENVEYIAPDAFSGCSELEEIKIEEKNNRFIYNNGILTSSSKNILFVSKIYYEKVSKFEIPNGIVEFSCNISNLDNITQLTIPETLKKINARNLPSNIEKVDVADANKNLKIVENCIYTKIEPETLVYCYSKATDIILQEKSESIQEFAFKGAINAVKIVLNNETKNISNQVFSGCNKLKTVILGRNVKNINPLFVLWQNDTNVIIDENNENYIMDNGILYNKEKNIIIAVTYQINGKFKVIDKVTEIGNNAFYGQSSMTEIDLNKIQLIDGQAFRYCTNLNEVEIPSTTTNIAASAFSATTSLQKIIIHRKENAIPGSPFGSPFGLRAITWDGTN